MNDRPRHILGPADLTQGEMRRYPLPRGRELLVVKLDGVHHGLDDWCNHAGCSLAGGELRGHAVFCPCHDMSFDVRTGGLLTEPRLCDDQTHFEVVEEAGQLVVLGVLPGGG